MSNLNASSYSTVSFVRMKCAPRRLRRGLNLSLSELNPFQHKASHDLTYRAVASVPGSMFVLVAMPQATLDRGFNSECALR